MIGIALHEALHDVQDSGNMLLLPQSEEEQLGAEFASQGFETS